MVNKLPIKICINGTKQTLIVRHITRMIQCEHGKIPVIGGM